MVQHASEEEEYMSKPIYASRLRDLSQERRELTPETETTFNAFSQKAFAEGALPTKGKQTIAVAGAHVTQCPYCIKGQVHLKLIETLGE
jgi:AhpD family alkylhydroperoxidase